MTDILISLPSTEPLLSVQFLTRNSNNRHSYCDWSFTYMYVYLLYMTLRYANVSSPDDSSRGLFVLNSTKKLFNCLLEAGLI